MTPTPRASRSLQRQFWLLIAQGLPSEDAAARVGVSGRVVRTLFAQAGGMPPLCLTPPSSRHLSEVDRETIYAGLCTGQSCAGIARSIGRATSTVTRELAANRLNPRRPRAVPARRRAGRFGKIPIRPNYSPRIAQQHFEARLTRPKTAKLAGNRQLHGEVETRLTREHSPEQISRRLRTDYPDQPEMQVSHETIYQSLYVQGRGALRRELTTCLRTGRAVRKPRRRSQRQQTRISDMVNISQRPAEVADRAVPGHWEGDLIVGCNSGSAIGTLVERRTRFTTLLHLPGQHTADAVRDAMIAAMQLLPEHLRRTLTWDQGIEMAQHHQIAASLDLQVYFCDPHSPWQRGTNENTNGLLRQYFPKGTDLSVHAADTLTAVADRLNTRPRKTLGWQTPAEAFAQLISTQTVATTP